MLSSLRCHLASGTLTQAQTFGGPAPLFATLRENIILASAKNPFYGRKSRAALGSLLCDGALLNIWGRKSSISIGNLHYY